MSETLYACLLAALPVAALLFGVWLGAKGERQAWIDHALKRPHEPRGVEGEVYYVIPENKYCAQCHVRRALTEEGLAGETSEPVTCELGRKL